MLAQAVIPAGGFAATYSTELQEAYNWAYSKSITTMSPIDNANMYGAITRAELAKMLANWAKDKGQTPDTSKACNFTDTASVKGDLAVAIVESCQLGLMGQGISAFRPYDTITRAEFGTALSRALWGSENEGGTPYYTNHLNALKEAWIMNVITNAENTKEVRGYVMLMLMRTDSNPDALCQLCMTLKSPEECGCTVLNPDVVTSGDLEVKASAAENRKALLKGGVSDLDTLTFKTSEEVEISKIVLERYGYSTNDDVHSVRLEDANGNTISNIGTLNTKGQANLTLKKDYRKVDGKFNATIVLKTTVGAKQGTIWFKVVDAVSTARNLNLSDYTPYTYDMVEYAGVKVTLSSRGWQEDHNFEAGKLFEVAKFNVKAPGDSAINVYGFTLTNNANPTVDVERFFDRAVVKVNSDTVNADISVNRDDQVVVAFNKAVLIPAKDKTEFVVELAMTEDFNDYGQRVQYKIDVAEGDIGMRDVKNVVRTQIVDNQNPKDYFFNGGKVRLTYNKLGAVEYAVDSVDGKIAEGNITVGEAIKWNLKVTMVGAAKDDIQAMRLLVAGDEYEGRRNWNDFEFNNVEIEKSGKIEILVDIKDTATEGNTATFAIDGWADFYYVAGKPANKIDVSGSLVPATKLTIQAARASLTKDISKAVEFKLNEVNRKVVFEGTYTAKKGDVRLNSFLVEGDAALAGTNPITFYLSIDGEEVADARYTYGLDEAFDTFSNVKIAANEWVKIVVEAEVNAKALENLKTFKVTLAWEDVNGNDAGEAFKNTVNMEVVESASINLYAGATRNTVLLKASDSVLAEFTVKPSNTSSEVDFDKLIFTLPGITPDDVTVTVDGIVEETTDAPNFKYEPNVTLAKEGVVVKVVLNDEDKAVGTLTLTVTDLNADNAVNRAFNKRFEKALVYLKSQTNQGDYTSYKLAVDKYEDDAEVKNLELFTDTACDPANKLQIDGLGAKLHDGDTFMINNKAVTETIKCIKYQVDAVISINAGTYSDYFKIKTGTGEDARRVFSNK